MRKQGRGGVITKAVGPDPGDHYETGGCQSLAPPHLTHSRYLDDESFPPLFSGFSGLPYVGIVKYRVLCGYKGNNKCAWMETVTQMCRGDFKIRAHLGDTNRMFSFVVILLPSIHHLSIRVVRSTPKSILSKSKDTVLKCYFSSKIIKYLIEKKKLGIKLQVTIQLLLSVYLSV